MTRFSKKTYELVARHIATIAAEADGFVGDEHQYAVLAALEGLALDFADTFMKDNPRFDSRRFMIACAIPSFIEETPDAEGVYRVKQYTQKGRAK